MATVSFPNSNLPTTSQPWGREVEKQLVNVSLLVKSNEINNNARDTQLSASLNRVNLATINAQSAADAAAAAAGTANDALASILSVEEAVYYPGTTEIDGGNIRANTIAANKISAGTLTGFTIQTGYTGSRVEIGGADITNIKFYDSSNIITGEIVADSSVFNLRNVKDGNGIWGTGSRSSLELGQGSATIYLNNGSFGASLTMGVTLASFTTAVEGYGFSAGLGGFGTSGFSAGSGEVKSQAIYDATSSQAQNVHIQGSANNYRIYRSTSASTREIKKDIRPLDFDKDAYINIEPVVFKYVDGILREEEKDSDIIGFIAEDFIDAGLSEHLVTQPQSEDEYMSLRYDKMYMFLHGVVKSQQDTIKELNSRLEALENK